MQIYVKTIFGKLITLDLEQSNTILDMKEMLKEKANIPAWFQVLAYSGKFLLNNFFTLGDYNLQKESWLLLLIAPIHISKSIELQANERIYKINISLNYFSLVEDIKFQIQDETGFSWDDILVFNEVIWWEDYQSIVKI